MTQALVKPNSATNSQAPAQISAHATVVSNTSNTSPDTKAKPPSPSQTQYQNDSIPSPMESQDVVDAYFASD